METSETQLCKTVQHNCDISDARYARDYSMCVYLLRMQEHFRWKQSIPFNGSVDKEKLGGWVRETEDYWDSIEENDFQPIHINGKDYDPFDAEKINHALTATDLGYTSGIGRLGQPHFVLAQRTAQQQLPYAQLELGKELARDSITVPAMTRDGTIVIRHEAIKQMLWQMIAEWRLRKPDGPMSRIVAHYRINEEAPAEQQLTAAAASLSESIAHHERGEIIAGQHLGQEYRQMISQLQGRPAEGYARAVGDLMADAYGTWPYIVDKDNTIYLDFWMAGLQGIRQSLLEPTKFYLDLVQSKTPTQTLEKSIQHEQGRWHAVARQLLTTFKKEGVRADFKTAAVNAIQEMELHL